MRTLEQVMADYKKAEVAAKAANDTLNKYRTELQEIYHAARQALGIVELMPR